MVKERDRGGKTYFVREGLGGLYVIDQVSGNRFFRTKSGGWFWEVGPGNPFDEDVQLGDSAYLDEIAATANNQLLGLDNKGKSKNPQIK
ncbi:MAG: hypothetical protein XD98_0337 [Microgenomates bacterium 39_6]|nr:MAG: hypothetical protein XD98_0337 [Microgenomates bacterium 39_6]